MYDTIIVGSGPAGMSAGIYAARREMKTLILGRETGGQVIWASHIDNYPGFKSIESFDLINNMSEQTKSLGVEIKNETVKQITHEGDIYKLVTSNGEYEAKTVIVAMGLVPRSLNVPGEKELVGRGVNYCANCDGPLYKNKTVAVVGGGNAALDAAEVLSKIAQKVYLIHRFDKFEGFNVLVSKIKTLPNVEIVLMSGVKEVIGTNKIEKIKIANLETNEEKELNIDGLFVEIGRMADTELFSSLVERDKNNQIVINASCATSQPGIFAAGDVTNVEFKQIIIAAGQGAVAALSAYKYLQMKQN